MRTTFDEIISVVLEAEGGFVNHPLDRGGPTNHGITMSTYSNWLNRPVSVDEVEALTVEVATDIYREVYWDPARVEQMPDHLREVYFDAVVNHGQGNAVRILQIAANSVRDQGDKISEDGIIGPNTVRVANDQRLTREIFVCYRVLTHAAIVLGADTRNRSDQEAFWLGWLRRDLKGLE